MNESSATEQITSPNSNGNQHPPIDEDSESYQQIHESQAWWKSITTNELLHGIGYGLWYSKHHITHSYIIIPSGLIILFTILYGLNQLLSNVFKINFPASVLGMLINLVVLSVLTILSNLSVKETEETVKSHSYKEKVSSVSSFILTNYLMIIKPSMNFTLKWINVFFIPSFIILPLSDAITFIECLKIAGVFVIGGLLLICVDVYMILGLKWILSTLKFGKHNDNIDENKKHEQSKKEEDNEDEEGLELTDMSNTDNVFLNDTNRNVFTSMRDDDITTIDLQSLRSTKTEPIPKNSNKIRSLSVHENPFNTEENSIDLPIEPEQSHVRGGHSPLNSLFKSNTTPPFIKPSISPSESSTPSNSSNEAINQESPIEHLNENTKKIIVFITNYIDWIFYITLFIVSIPFYYVKSIHTFLPYHLGITIISYYLALLIPLKWPKLKKFAHPILVLTAEILFVCFIGSLIYHSGKPKGFLDDLKYYKTGKNYLNLFNHKTLYNNGKSNPNTINLTSTPEWPGCGDVLSSLMDISIVSLSLPMFTHRKDFIKNFWVLMPPILASVCLTFFVYPVVCYHIGIAPLRAIGFIGRSVTLALGTPLINSLGGSISLMAVCTILSGICGVLVGDSIFSLLRVSSDDYVTRGVTLGINCGAIATAHLLNIDPRAASMSSLSFSIFGTIMIILASINVIRELINNWVGL